MTPLGQAGGSALFESVAAIEMALVVEMVVDRGTTRDAFELLVLTAARSSELRLATWEETDLDAGVWTIPAVRMKAKRDHRLPLSELALTILHDTQRRTREITLRLT